MGIYTFIRWISKTFQYGRARSSNCPLIKTLYYFTILNPRLSFVSIPLEKSQTISILNRIRPWGLKKDTCLIFCRNGLVFASWCKGSWEQLLYLKTYRVVVFDGSRRFHTAFSLSRPSKDSGLFWMDRDSSTLRSLCRGLVKTQHSCLEYSLSVWTGITTSSRGLKDWIAPSRCWKHQWNGWQYWKYESIDWPDAGSCRGQL
jgi:hypothetical protein